MTDRNDKISTLHHFANLLESYQYFVTSSSYVFRVTVITLYLVVILLSVIYFSLDVNSDDGSSAFLFITLISISFFPFLYIFGRLLYWTLFNYGLSAGRSLLTFIAFILIGWAGVDYARSGQSFLERSSTTSPEMIDSNAVVGEKLLDPKIALVLDVAYEADARPDGGVQILPPDDFEEAIAEEETTALAVFAPDDSDETEREAVPARERTDEDTTTAVTTVKKAAQAMKGQAEEVSKAQEESGFGLGVTRIRGQVKFAEASPCNLNVSSLLYAMDLFIPLIDLDQRRHCTIRDRPPKGVRDDLRLASPDKKDPFGNADDPYFTWRLLKTIYNILGWIVSSLVILSLSGVLRRDLER